MTTVFMFSGMGSQYYQMGASLYARNRTFCHHLRALDTVLQDRHRVSVLDVIYAKEKTLSQPFDDIVLSGLAIFMMEVSLVRTLQERGVMPDVLLGSSLGTIVASVVSGCIMEEDAIDLLFQSGTIMRDSCGEGAMLAILANSSVHRDYPELHQSTEIAGVNFDNNFIISLPGQDIDRVTATLNANSIVYQQMPIRRAYHSTWIEPAKEGILHAYSSIGKRRPNLPIYCCSSSDPVQFVESNRLWQAMREPMRLSETINFLEKSGTKHYIDVGPTGTLATCLKYILPPTSASQITQVMSPMRLDDIVL